MMPRRGVTRIRVVLAVSLALVVVSLVASFVFPGLHGSSGSDVVTDSSNTGIVDATEEFTGGVFYVSETPFPCGPALQDMCTTLEAAPLEILGLVCPELGYYSDCFTMNMVWSTAADEGANVPGATGTAIGTGYKNTLAILAAGDSQSSGTVAAYADAYVADDKDDWYLPSRDELNELCKAVTRHIAQPTGGKCPGFLSENSKHFDLGNYWSSSQSSPSTSREMCENFNPNEVYSCAWYQNFVDGAQSAQSKYMTAYVRLIRAF